MMRLILEPDYDKTNTEASDQSLRKFGLLATHKAHTEDCSDWVDARDDLSLR